MFLHTLSVRANEKIRRSHKNTDGASHFRKLPMVLLVKSNGVGCIYDLDLNNYFCQQMSKLAMTSAFAPFETKQNHLQQM